MLSRLLYSHIGLYWKAGQHSEKSHNETKSTPETDVVTYKSHVRIQRISSIPNFAVLYNIGLYIVLASHSNMFILPILFTVTTY